MLDFAVLCLRKGLLTYLRASAWSMDIYLFTAVSNFKSLFRKALFGAECSVTESHTASLWMLLAPAWQLQKDCASKR